MKKSNSIILLVPICVFTLFNHSCSNVSKTADMVYLEGGILTTVVPYTNQEKEVKVSDYFIDKDLVSFADFASFVKETNYVTEAEKFGNSLTFDYADGRWKILGNINYKYPQVQGEKVIGIDHPVTQVSWNDAKCYCEHQGKRLPTDNEWELAAKNGSGSYNKIYSWGDSAKKGDAYAANYWQGNFPYDNQVLDGFKYTSPVGHFGKNGIGMTDMGGNVWEWCQDAIAPTPEEARSDPAMRKVQRGGSFLCDPAVCHGFNVNGRSSSTPETGASHVGFRCAKDAR